MLGLLLRGVGLVQLLRELRGARRRPPARPGPVRRPPPQRPPAPAAEPSPEQVFTSELRALRHIARVRTDTVVVLFTGDERPELREPGELLIPGAHPLRATVEALVVRVAPVQLQVGVAELTTLDDRALDVTVDIAVELQHNALTSHVLALATQYRGDLGRYLTQAVGREVEAAVRQAVRMNNAADLHRQGLREILEDRWLARTMVGGALIRTSLTVLLSWRERPHRSDEADRPLAVDDIELSMDVRLRRLWRLRTGSDPLGIAGARVSGRSTVIAVVDAVPPPDDRLDLLDDLGAAYHDETPALVVITDHGSYAGIVRSWFRQLDLTDTPTPRIEIDPDQQRLVVRLSARPTDPHWQGVDGSQVAALRRLLPHGRVEVELAADVDAESSP